MSFLKTVNVAVWDNTCIKVYDPNEVDPGKKLIDTYENHKKAANALGVYPPMVHKSCSRKIRIYSTTFKKEVTCRLCKKEKAGST